MIPRLHTRAHLPHGPLEEALGQPLSPNAALPPCTLVARWPRPGPCRLPPAPVRRADHRSPQENSLVAPHHPRRPPRGALR